MSEALRETVKEYQRRSGEKYRGSTHWEGCEEDHLHCYALSLILALTVENASLETKIKEMIGRIEK